MKTERIEIRISEQQKKRLDEKAKKTGMSTSEALRYLIQRWLDD